jgi:putative photosynthetic complex assembly protein
MANGFSDPQVPRPALIGLAALVAAALLAAGAGRLGYREDTRPTTASVEERALRFVDQDEGSILVVEAGTQRTLDVLAPGTNGFIRGAMRGLVRERKRRDLGPEEPFRLIRYADGRLSLDDPATGHRIDLGSFGATNAQAFARLLTAGEAAR